MPNTLTAQRRARLHETTHCPTDAALGLALNLDRTQIALAKEYNVLPLSWLMVPLSVYGVDLVWVMTGQGSSYVTEKFLPLHFAALLQSDDNPTSRTLDLVARYLLEYPPFFQPDPHFSNAVGRALAATDTANMVDLANYLAVPPEESGDARRHQRLPLHWLFRLVDRGLSPDWICEGRGPRSLAQATA